jgi:hypothetical protein
MNLNATPDTLRAIAKALQRAGFLDDRIGQPDKARIAAWAEQIQPYRFTDGDMLDGVSRYYSGPVDRAIGIGDLIHHSKQARVDRTASETREQREARQEALSAKAAEDIEALAERKGLRLGADRVFLRGGPDTAKSVVCPWCKARPGQPCVEPSSGKPLTHTPYHPGRVDAWGGKTA